MIHDTHVPCKHKIIIFKYVYYDVNTFPTSRLVDIIYLC